MGEATVENGNRRMEVLVPDSADRLCDLLSTFSVLRNNGQALIDQIRGSLSEMRELRTRLRRQHDPLIESERNGGGNGHTSLKLRYGLTSREAQVAILLVQGQSNSAIAEQLTISPHTARHHTQRILSKLGVHSRAAAGAKLRNL
jgi:DNA-binding NarL/FixJ family response regulator